MLQAVGSRCAGIVRVPSGDDVWLKKALDIGADGVIVPLVRTAAEAAAIASACKYPPEGTRGVGLSRAHQYGMGFEEYMQIANEEVAVILQAENRDAVDNIEAIVAVEGIDAIFIGPYDLSASLGKTGQVDDPEVVAAINHVRDTCIGHNVRLGYFGATAQAAQPYIAQGFTLVTAGTDALLLTKSAADTLKTLKK
jgi:2-keto-3-deoxy-L-rhamnonate aldolase RhmA